MTPVAGVDMSHRGGRPGFVRRRRGDSLVFPDFAGNRHYNTLGNLLLNPQLALLFIDFESGHLLEIQGRAALQHDPGACGGYPGAERFVAVEVERRAVIGRLPWRWSLLDLSPALPAGGTWGDEG